MNISIKTAIILGVMLAFGSQDLAAFHIRLYPASEVYDPDTEVLHERLGLTGEQLLVEDFETADLQTWLHTNLRGGGGEGTERNAWSGNIASAYADSADLRIDLPDVRLLGIGLGDNDGGSERISVNGDAPIALNTLPSSLSDLGEEQRWAVLGSAVGDNRTRTPRPPGQARSRTDRSF